MAGDEEGTFREDSREAPREGRWLTYDEIAKTRGIGRPSAVKLAQRERWQRRPGNDRTARVLVPLDWLKPARRLVEGFMEDFPETSRELSRVVAVLEDAVAGLRERSEADAATIALLRGQLDRAEKAATGERDSASRAEARADRAEQGKEGERARADALRDRIDAMQAEMATVQAQLATAEAEGDTLTIETAELTAQVKAAKVEAREAQDAAEALRQADAARRGRGRLARLRAAWRGQ